MIYPYIQENLRNLEKVILYNDAKYFGYCLGFFYMNYGLFLIYNVFMENSPFEHSEYILDSDDVDSNARMRVVAFCNFMQNLAGSAAEKRGFGITFMRENGLVWVLAKAKVRILNYPVFNDSIKLETWVRGVNRIVTDRHFIINRYQKKYYK
jgi:acyl-ACP thioesterase